MDLYFWLLLGVIDISLVFGVLAHFKKPAGKYFKACTAFIPIVVCIIHFCLFIELIILLVKR